MLLKHLQTMANWGERQVGRWAKVKTRAEERKANISRKKTKNDRAEETGKKYRARNLRNAFGRTQMAETIKSEQNNGNSEFVRSFKYKNELWLLWARAGSGLTNADAIFPAK